MDGVYSQQAIWQKEWQQADKELKNALAQADEAEERAAEAQKQAAKTQKLLQESIAREKRVILKLFHEGYTLQYIADTFEISPEEVEQIINE